MGTMIDVNGPISFDRDEDHDRRRGGGHGRRRHDRHDRGDRGRRGHDRY